MFSECKGSIDSRHFFSANTEIKRNIQTLINTFNKLPHSEWKYMAPFDIKTET